MTITEAKQIVKDAGFEPLNGACHETETYVYACSVESDRRCYNHPMFEVQYSKGSGWLSVSGRKPVQMQSRNLGQAPEVISTRLA